MRSPMKHLVFAALALLGGAIPALAHPGHDAPAATHWVSDLSHLAVVAALAALCVVGIGGLVARRRRMRRKRD